MIKALYLGQKWIGERCFQILRQVHNSSMQICAAVSNIDTRVWWKTNVIYRECIDAGIPFLSNAGRQTTAIMSLITDGGIDVIISVQHPWILPGEILRAVDYNAFNLHNAKLPNYKGHNCCNHAILNSERYYTSTMHYMTEGVDEGSIAFEETFEINAEETARGLYDRANEAGLIVFRKLVDALVHDQSIPRKPMPRGGVFYPRNSLGDLRGISNMRDQDEVDKKARALFFPPFEPAYYVLNGQKHYILPKAFSLYAHEFYRSWEWWQP